MAASTPQSTTDLVLLGLQRSRADVRGALLSGLLLVALLAGLLILVTLVWDVVVESLPVFRERGFEFVSGRLSADPAKAGAFQGIMGSIALTVIVVVVAFPVGVAAAIYLEEYAPNTRLTRFIDANIRNLAGVPSIVYGLLGLAVFVRGYELVLGLDAGDGRVVIAGGLTLAVLVLPIMIITAAEAIRAVPVGIREASLGVGATQWETIRHQVLPVALPAILTGSVLTIARAFGEAAPLLLAGAVLGNFFSVSQGAGLIDLIASEKYTALPIVIFNWVRQPQAEFQQITAAGIVVLLVMLMSVNAGAILVRDRFAKRVSS
jgi:phosphate transport system permease protein